MLSIIVSVYNVKPYIEECVNSVLQLKIPIEVIIVHDLDKDNSFRGEEEFLKDKRITILNRTNAGLGVARNQGAEVAKGNYIFFLDGDDKIYADRFEQIYNCGLEADVDIIAGDYDDTDNPKKCKGPNSDGHLLMSGKNFLFNYCSTMKSCVWRYFFKKSFLLDNDLEFGEVKYFEDILFLPKVLYLAEKIYFENIPFYYYRYTENTLSNIFNKKRTKDIFACFKILNNESKLMTYNVGQVLRNDINNLVLGTIYYARKKNGLDSELEKEAKCCLCKMKSNQIGVNLFLFVNRISWFVFNFLNDTYFATRIGLGKIKRKIKNKI